MRIKNRVSVTLISSSLESQKGIQALLGLYCWFAFAGYAQTAATPAAAGAISGIVVDGAANAPVRRAIVTLSTVETVPQDAVAWTDANGRFIFGYLPAGRYQLRAAKDGYQGAAFGAETPRRPAAIIQLATGQFRSDIVFRLQLMNSISGVVLDEDGDPLAGVQVMAMRPGFQRQKRKLLPGMGTMTDSAGHYRLSGLTPGKYAVVASDPNRPAAKMRPEAVPGEPQPQYSYGVQYYPGSDRAESAAFVNLQPGQEISQIDFRLTTRPAATLRGKIIMPPGAASVSEVSVNIMSVDFGNRMNIGLGAAPPDFTFGGPQFAPGSYMLVAQATVDGKRCRGIQSVDLGSQGLRDITITIEPAIDLEGHVSVEGPDSEKHSVSFVNLVPGDGIPWNAPPPRATVNKDGSFKISSVPPGVWDIGVGPIPPGGYIKSMRLGDQDVLTEEMAIHTSTTEPLKIVLATRAATIEGDVLQADQPARAVVLLAPDGKFRNVTSFYRFVTADDKGHFEIKNAVPGQYRLYAFEEFDQQSIQDPDYLKPFESAGVPVTLVEGPNASQKLSVMASDRPPATAAPPSQTRGRQ